MTITVGFDPGNSEATLATAPVGGRGTSLTIPSALGTGDGAELRRVRGGIGGEALDAHEYCLELDGRAQFVGSLALAQSPDATTARGDIGRYWGGHTLRLLLTLAATVLRPSEVELRVVTGLPVQSWSKETVRRVQQSLGGTHQFVLNGRPRTVRVTGVLVVMEGAGALAAHGLGEDVPQAVIDIGGRTTDLFWAQGMRPLLPRCAGRPLGVEKAGDLVAQQFAQSYGRALHPVELRSVLRSASGDDAPPLFVDGTRVTVDALVREALAGVGSEIASFVAQTWRSSEQGKVAGEAAQVLLIGGGAHYFAPPLKQLIRHLQVPRHPELANAQGYLALGLQVPDAHWARLTT